MRGIAFWLLLFPFAAVADLTATGTIVDDDTNVAHFWFDADGGTCSRQSPAGAYSDAGACSTLQAAYAAASCGDVIRVATADYSAGADQDQQLVEDASASSCGGNPIIIRGEVGERPTFRHIRLGDFVGNCASDGPDNIEFYSLDVVWGIDIEQDSDSIVVDDFDGGAFGLGGGICGAPNNVPPNNITIRNGDWGPCSTEGTFGDCRNQYTDSPAEGKNKISDGASNLLIENNVIHDFIIEEGSGVHFECIWVGGWNGVTIRGNWFYNCVTNAIALPDGPDMQGTALIENNWVGDQGNAQVAIKFGAMSDVVGGEVIIRYNSLGGTRASIGNEVSDSYDHTGVYVVGNIIANGIGCMSNAYYRYNLYLDTTGCHATDDQITPLPYVDDDGLGSGDYHLSGTTAANGFVPDGITYGDIADDKDGDSRSTPRDAGADEQ